MPKYLFCILAATVALIGLPASAAETEKSKPNIIVILADDLGYGDPSCYGGKIVTPHIDRLAATGMRFTDAHTSSSVCTPTRYGLLTGRYNWRSKLKAGVLGGLSPRLIEPDRLTMASFLKSNGYYTGCIGKWHLGMNWVVKPGTAVSELGIESRAQSFNVDYAQPIAGGPNSVGFDYYYGISASLDMVPYTFIENTRVVALPTEDRAFPMMQGREKKTRAGPAAPGFEAADVLPTLTRKACEYIDERSADAKAGRPFLLYLPLASPHTPILPASAWLGKSGVSPYADFVMQTDAAVGEVMATLERQQLTGDTLIVFTSDNGCSPEAGFSALAEHGHHPSGPLRGHKADLFEGGHRVPFVVRWPVHVTAGTVSPQLVCLTDVLATVAEVLGQPLRVDAGEDSVSFLGALLGQEKAGREELVSHSINGAFAIRRGTWKLLLCADSGGWSAPKPSSKEAAALPARQLYDLAGDLGEKNNLVDQHPEKAAELTALLEKIVADGRSTPGPKQTNTGAVEIRRGMRKGP